MASAPDAFAALIAGAISSGLETPKVESSTPRRRLAATVGGVLGVALSSIHRFLWKRAQRPRPQDVAVLVRLGREHAVRRNAVLDPFFERGQRVEACLGDARPRLRGQTAMVHAGDHEEAKVIGNTDASRLLDGGVVVERVLRRDDRIREMCFPRLHVAGGLYEAPQVKSFFVEFFSRHFLSDNCLC